jgi:hypothetical protein
MKHPRLLIGLFVIVIAFAFSASRAAAACGSYSYYTAPSCDGSCFAACTCGCHASRPVAVRVRVSKYCDYACDPRARVTIGDYSYIVPIRFVGDADWDDVRSSYDLAPETADALTRHRFYIFVGDSGASFNMTPRTEVVVVNHYYYIHHRRSVASN